MRHVINRWSDHWATTDLGWLLELTTARQQTTRRIAAAHQATS